MTLERFLEIIIQLKHSYLQDNQFDLFWYSIEGAINAVEGVDLKLQYQLREFLNKIESDRFMLEDEELKRETIKNIEYFQKIIEQSISNN